MKTLFKVELLRLLKSKQFLISIIASIVIVAIESLIVFTVKESRSAYSSIETATTMSSITSDGGIIAAIFLVAFIGTDIKDGTIRNKIVSGYTRTQILVSYYVAGLLFVFATLFATFLASFLIVTIKFNPAFVHYTLLYFLDTILFKLISIVFITSVAIFLTCSLNGRVLPIILMLAFIFALLIAGSITEALADHFDGVTRKVFNFITNINYYYCTTTIGNSETTVIKVKMEYEAVDIFRLVVMPIIYIAFNTLGIWAIFNRKDFK